MAVYLNNAATTWPKPEPVARAVYDFMTRAGANLARGAAAKRDIGTMDMVMSCREKLAALFGGHENADPRYVTFASNVTESLNIVLKGFLKPGMRVLTTSMEHNASMRPLRRLETQGVAVTVLQCDAEGVLPLADLRETLENDRYDMMILTHASNVCGTVQDLSGIADICRGYGVPLVLDSAQTAGVLPIDATALNLAALCFTGHKGLFGPQGTGGILWRPDFAEATGWFVEGGTGSYSHLEFHPDKMPDKFEAGTPNLPGIAGLNAALDWLAEEGMEKIHARERDLAQRLLDGLAKLPGVRFAGRTTMKDRLAVIAVNFDGTDNGILASELVDRAGIETRPGLHCAPTAHKTLGTSPHGALRLSPGYFNTESDIDLCLEALAGILKIPAK